MIKKKYTRDAIDGRLPSHRFDAVEVAIFGLGERKK